MTEPAILFLKALAHGDEAAVARLTLGRRVDFDRLARVLVEERMGVYTHARLAERGLLALVPRRVAEPIRWQHAEQQERDGLLAALLEEVQGALARAGIACLVLKGLPLAQRCWGGVGRRFGLDLDLLVEREQFLQARRVLADLAFAVPKGVPLATRLALSLSHALEVRRAGLSLDLHWTLRNRPGLRFDLAGVWRRAGQDRVSGVDCRVPGDEDQLVMLLVGLANDLERGHHRLRSFWDIYLLAKAMPDTDWRAFWADRAAEGLAVLLPNVLALVLQRLDCAEELPALAAALAASADRLLVREPHDLRRLLANGPQRLANRRWFARLLPVPPWRYWAWWGTTLPLRLLLGRHV